MTRTDMLALACGITGSLACIFFAWLGWRLYTQSEGLGVGVDYCTTHHGIREADEDRCDFADDPLPCDLHEVFYR